MHSDTKTKRMKHFIFCRYNTGMFSSNVYKVSDPLTWMAHRLPKYVRLLESLAAQTNQNFTFVIAMDEKTPKEWIDSVIETTENHIKNYILIFDIHQIWVNSIVIEEDWVITSRIDNDDAYKPYFVDAISKAFSYKIEVLDVMGIQIDELTGKKYTSGRVRPNSPFLSFSEPNQGTLATCYDRPHSVMPDDYLARFISGETHYIQYIHDRNVTNKIQGELL